MRFADNFRIFHWLSAVGQILMSPIAAGAMRFVTQANGDMNPWGLPRGEKIPCPLLFMQQVLAHGDDMSALCVLRTSGVAWSQCPEAEQMTRQDFPGGRIHPVHKHAQDGINVTQA